MTGLDPANDTILSLSCIITDHALNPLDTAGFDAIVHHDSVVLSAMNPWCIEHHGASGLTAACLASTTTAAQAATDLLAYIKNHVPEKGKALLAGNSVHADKAFLNQGAWAEAGVLGWLHYRILDVSAIKEAVRRWCSPTVLEQAPHKKYAHTAREDILESIDEARFYKELIENVRVGAHINNE